MNIFEQMKKKYELETNIKGNEYINALEEEVEFLQKVNMIAIHLMNDKQNVKLAQMVRDKSNKG